MMCGMYFGVRLLVCTTKYFDDVLVERQTKILYIVLFYAMKMYT